MSTTDARAWLAAAQERANVATEGPWATDEDGDESSAVYSLAYPGPGTIYVAQNIAQGDEDGMTDAEFIAAARTEHPAMTAALLAVLDLHRESTVYATESGDCEHGDDCDGIMASDGYFYCPDGETDSTCLECAAVAYDHGADDYPEWPCATVRAITDQIERTDKSD